jgi:hypothetical protein
MIQRKILEIRKTSREEAAFTQSLMNLGSIVRERLPQLHDIGSDPQLIDDVNRLADELPNVCARRAYEKQVTEELYGLRNRAYTLLAKAIEEIRLCARYVLADNLQRLRGYASEYFRKSSRAERQMEKCG